MASRAFTSQAWSLEKARVTLFATVDFDSGGAPTLKAWSSSAQNPGGGSGSYIDALTSNPGGAIGFAGVASISGSAGDYIITLNDSYQRLLGFSATVIKATASVTPSVQVKAESVTTQAGGTIEFLTLGITTGAVAIVTPATIRVLFQIDLSNSSAY